MQTDDLVPPLDPGRLAAAARSVLACPDEVQLVVDGVDDLMAGAAPDPFDPDGPSLGMQDHGGRPVFTCPPGAALARAALDGRGALLTLTSGLGAPGSSDRDATLTISGDLVTEGAEACPCCDDLRVAVTLVPTFVVLRRISDPEGVRCRVPLAAFGSPDHQLNRGFLQRSAEHANACHQDELRHAVATTTHTRVGDVLGVQLAGLRPEGVEVRWLDPLGAHLRRLTFLEPATTPEELGERLRKELHAGLC